MVTVVGDHFGDMAGLEFLRDDAQHAVLVFGVDAPLQDLGVVAQRPVQVRLLAHLTDVRLKNVDVVEIGFHASFGLWF